MVKNLGLRKIVPDPSFKLLPPNKIPLSLNGEGDSFVSLSTIQFSFIAFFP
jgi:hypothetical protein